MARSHFLRQDASPPAETQGGTAASADSQPRDDASAPADAASEPNAEGAEDMEEAAAAMGVEHRRAGLVNEELRRGLEDLGQPLVERRPSVFRPRHCSSNSLVIAATNHGDRLDKALYRRFDDLIEFGLPDSDHIWETIEARLSGLPAPRLGKQKILKAANGLSFSEITRACEEATKEMLLRDRKTITTDNLVAALTERRLFLNH